MIDFNHVVNAPGFNVQTFFGTTQNNLSDWRTWIKPRGSRMLWFVSVGGGGAGGEDVGVGGGGGGSGGQSSVILPTTMVPDTLYIQAGMGGRNPGEAGLDSFVSLEPNTVLVDRNMLLRARGGFGGVGAIAGAGGAASNISEMPVAGRGLSDFFAGQAGSAGGNAAPGTNIIIPQTGLMVSGGAGGGDTGLAGGSVIGVTGSDFFPTIPGGASGLNGGAGYTAENFTMFYGGSGGGGGANGGNAAYGAGGGGAGAGGQNGYGGDGMILVLSW